MFCSHLDALFCKPNETLVVFSFILTLAAFFLPNLPLYVSLLGQLPRCLRDRQFALGWNDIAVPEMFVPECTTDGKYEKVQCHTSSGVCWCSDSDGHIYSGTKVQGKPDCSNLPGKAWGKIASFLFLVNEKFPIKVCFIKLMLFSFVLLLFYESKCHVPDIWFSLLRFIFKRAVSYNPGQLV